MNDHIRSQLRFWGTWVVCWLALLGLALLDGQPLEAGLRVTPLLFNVALMTLLGFYLQDNVTSAPIKWLSLFAAVVVASTINTRISPAQFGPASFARELFNAGLIMAIAFAIRYGMNTLRAKGISQRAEKLRKLAEQRALNARLTPHVLYNMLNAIYAASLKEPAKASELILALSSMMRHLTDAADKDFVDAQSELDFMRHYADLTQAQADSPRLIRLEFPTAVDIQIPNLLCVTLFENAVTHSKPYGPDSQIRARFEELPEGFLFSVENTLGEGRQDAVNNLHTGINTVTRRLDYLFPGRYEFISRQTSTNRYLAEIKTW